MKDIGRSGKLLATVIAIVVAVIASSCDKPLPTLTGMDMNAWKSDKKGCNGVRAGVVSQLTAQRNLLQGLSEMQVIGLLGRPDEYDLYKRHQKFFTYLLEPGKACGRSTEPRKLSIRFNATGAAKEIAVD